VDFAEPSPDDTCLDVVCGTSVLTSAIGPRVRKITSADASALPAGPFSLVTVRLALSRSSDPIGLLRELLRVCQGRLVLADLVRTRAGDGSHIERLRDPERTATRALPELTDMLGKAGGRVRRLDMFTIERPVDSWVAKAPAAERIRRELAAELEGGPATGSRPRLIGSELWFSQSWAYIAAEPVTGPKARRRRRR
jgi:hypothetical protein